MDFHEKILGNFVNFTGKYSQWGHAFNEDASWACHFIRKGVPLHVPSYKFCETFKNNYFIEHIWTAVCKHISIRLSLNNPVSCTNAFAAECWRTCENGFPNISLAVPSVDISPTDSSFDGHFHDPTFLRLIISPTRHSSDQTFHWKP